jgi:hypothetical protein
MDTRGRVMITPLLAIMAALRHRALSQPAKSGVGVPFTPG